MSRVNVDIKQFALRVERMCEFILDQMEEKTDTPEQIFLQDLKKDAADIQFHPRLYGDISLNGLDEHIRGMINQNKE